MKILRDLSILTQIALMDYLYEVKLNTNFQTRIQNFVLSHDRSLVKQDISPCKALQAHNPVSYSNGVFLHQKWRLFLLIYALCVQSALPPPSKVYHIPVGIKRRMGCQTRNVLGKKKKNFKVNRIYWPYSKGKYNIKISPYTNLMNKLSRCYLVL